MAAPYDAEAFSPLSGSCFGLIAGQVKPAPPTARSRRHGEGASAPATAAAMASRPATDTASRLSTPSRCAAGTPEPPRPAPGPIGRSVEWDAEIVEDLPNQRIAWKSVGDADVQNAGAVRFDDRGATTNIEASLEYDPPGGKAGELVAELFKDPDKQVQRAIDGFRRVVESGGLGAA
jgi:hypothetical protein